MAIVGCLLALCFTTVFGTMPTAAVQIYTDVSATASSEAGPAYGAGMAVDGKVLTRWASAAQATTPQWLELCFPKFVVVDVLQLTLAVDTLYGPWASLQLSFSDGTVIEREIGENEDHIDLRFPARETAFIRVTATALHASRHYIGIHECLVAYDPEHSLETRVTPDKPVPREALKIRGRATHPGVNLRPADVVAAKERVKSFPWAQVQRDSIVAEAERWLVGDDTYWLGFLPKPGACYAYGFTACPICDGNTGKWIGANCAWDKPGQVTCANGHTLPDADHPDDGEGYTAPDGRIHYFQGQFNAWATEQWTLKALPALTQAYLLTDDIRYAERAALLLDALASIYKESTAGSWDYPSTPSSGRFARPWYQVARTLVHYVDYYDRLYHSSVLDQPSLRPGMARRENIEKNMLLDGAYYCYEHSYSGALHNGHADYLRGALAVGCLLDIPEFIRLAVEGPFSIYTMLDNNIDRDGRYYESSLGYGIHARELYLTFADPLYNLSNAEYPEGINLYDNLTMRNAILLPDTQVMLAGRRPNFGDSAPDYRYIAPGKPKPNESDRAFLERLHARTGDAAAQSDFAALLQWCNTSIEGDGHTPADPAWALWHDRALPDADGSIGLPAPYDRRIEGSWVAGMKGMAMLRAGNQAVLLRYGPSLNHGDPDDLGLSYYAEGYQLSYDLGYGLGSTHAHVGWASSTVSHALVTVNEKNQLLGEGSGGSLLWFADLPGVKAVAASSPGSYESEEVTTYRRSMALVGGRYLVDAFVVDGGSQHDFSFGSIGTDLTPFGVSDLVAQAGSLSAGHDWGRMVGADGDIKGYPNKPYWNPPPENGYGFFKDLQRGTTTAHWGGTWTLPGEEKASMRMHVVGDGGEAIIAKGPGLYPRLPDASYVMARRQGEAPLASTFLAVYEPFTDAPPLKSVRRVGPAAVEVIEEDGATAVILFGAQTAESTLGSLRFDGDFVYLRQEAGQPIQFESLGASSVEIDGMATSEYPGVFEAQVTAIDLKANTVTLDTTIPPSASGGLVTIFSNPVYDRTTAYHVLNARENTLHLDAATLGLGTGRVAEIRGATTLLSDIPHEYAKRLRGGASRFFNGKILRGERGGETRVRDVQPGSPMVMTVDDATVLQPGERFTYMDIVPGDTVRIALPKTGG